MTSAALVPRTGPVSRVYRIAFATLLLWAAYSIFLDGKPGFAAETIGEPGFWVLLIVVPHVFFQLPAMVSGRLSGAAVFAVFLLVLAVAGGLAFVVNDALWAPPLTSVVYGAVLLAALFTGAAFVLSVFLGTPGCEAGAVIELGRRIRGTYDSSQPCNYWCVVGLRRIDAWEARQPWRARRRAGTGGLR